MANSVTPTQRQQPAVEREHESTGGRIMPPIATPPKLRRRPGLIAVSVVLVCLGALVGAWLWVSASSAQEVLALRETVHRGELIEDADLMVVRVSVDPALHPVAASERGAVVGKRASLDLPAGGLLPAGAASEELLPQPGMSVVGLSLTGAQQPAEELHSGDPVRVVITPGDQGEVGDKEPATIQAVVIGVHTDEETGDRIVDVTVPAADAPKLAAWAATGKVAVIMDSAAGGRS
jgi:hypothetical protein